MLRTSPHITYDLRTALLRVSGKILCDWFLSLAYARAQLLYIFTPSLQRCTRQRVTEDLLEALKRPIEVEVWGAPESLVKEDLLK